jgi:hypothetical protein
MAGGWPLPAFEVEAVEPPAAFGKGLVAHLGELLRVRVCPLNARHLAWVVPDHTPQLGERHLRCQPGAAHLTVVSVSPSRVSARKRAETTGETNAETSWRLCPV